MSVTLLASLQPVFLSFLASVFPSRIKGISRRRPKVLTLKGGGEAKQIAPSTNYLALIPSQLHAKAPSIMTLQSFLHILSTMLPQY